MEILRVAAVTNDAMPVACLFINTKRHRVHLRQISELPRVHQPRRFRAENLCAFICAILKMSDHEACHVGRAGGDAARRERIDPLEMMGRLGGHVIAV